MFKINFFTLILLFGSKISSASTVFVSQTYGFNETDATVSIQNALDSQHDTIVIDNTGRDWIVKPLFVPSNKIVIFQPGVVLTAKQGEFQGLKDALITVTNANNIKILGYGATLRMRKADYQNTALYTHSEWRHAINIQAYVDKPVSNIVIRGFKIEKSGGDGILVGGISGYPNSDPVQPQNVLIQDVTCDDNHRQGISVTGGINVRVVNSTMKNTRGTAPQAGIDWEPDWERLSDVSMTNCYIANNTVSGLMMYLYRPAWRGPKTIGLTFDNCHVDSDSGVQGIGMQINHVEDVEGADGLITFNDCSFRNRTNYSTINIIDKSALNAKVVLNRCFIEQTTSAGSVVELATENVALKDVMTFGGLEFNNCIINDRYDRNFISFVDDIATGKGVRNVKGTFTVNNAFGAKYNMGLISQGIDIQVTENLSAPPVVVISQPAKYQQLETGAALTVTATASDADVGTANGSGIKKVAFEIQYADRKIYTGEDTQAPYTFSIPTSGWQRGIYLIKAIAVSTNLETQNISVNPFEITSSELVTQAPNVPLSLAVIPNSSSQITVTWVDDSTNETGLKLERSLTGTGGWTEIATMFGNCTSYINTGLLPSTSYDYRIRAINEVGDSIFSNIANTTTLSDTSSTMDLILSGTIAGTPPHGGTAAYTAASALDKNTATFFAPESADSYVRLDLGENTLGRVTLIRFFPRSGFGGRMNGAKFQGSANSSVWTDLHTISGIPLVQWNEVPIINVTYFRYLRYSQPVDLADVSEIEFRGITQVVTSALQTFRASHGLAADGSQDSSTPGNDGVKTLLKYAFNMIGRGEGQKSTLAIPNSKVLTFDGTAGLPLGGTNEAGKLTLTYMRRKVTSFPGISYTIQYATVLSSWAPNSSATEKVTSVDEVFERVTVTDGFNPTTKRFVRVRVSTL